MLTISQLFIYPVKSLGGISLPSAQLTDRGFKYDRRWMLVDENNRFLSQREFPVMALLQTVISEKGIVVVDKRNVSINCLIPFTVETDKIIKVQVWDDECDAVIVSETLNTWFTQALGISCKLVFMPDDSMRKVDDRYAANNEITSFSDGYPLLMIGQSSLDDLNGRLKEKLSIDRFRPNIVFTGGIPYEEDTMAEFEINGITLYGVKQCARCVVTTIEQSNAAKGKEPLKTLAAYRQLNNKIYFGQNVLYKTTGVINTGDAVIIKETKQALF
jgi:hypothetical protein